MKRLIAILSAVVMLVSCGVNDKAAYVAKVGNEEISEGEFKFYLSSIKSQMTGTELTSDKDWQTVDFEGRKAIDVAKEKTLEVAAENIAYIEVAKYLNISLTEEEEALVKTLKESFTSQYDLTAQGIDEEFVEMLCRSQVYSEKLAELAVQNNPITDEERNNTKNELSAQLYKAKHILIATVDTASMAKLSAEKIAWKKITADDVYKKVLAGEDFDTLMFKYSEDPGLQTSPDGYTFGPGEMVAEFENMTASLGDNEVGFVESDFGYHIIKRLPITDEVESALMLSRLNDAMTEWKQLAGITIELNETVFNGIM